jgi:nucleoid DNA-binding protein
LDNLHKIYKEVSEELGLSKATVESIAEAQFKFVVDTITARDLGNVRLQYLGKFGIKPGRLDHLERQSKESKEHIKKKLDELNK